MLLYYIILYYVCLSANNIYQDTRNQNPLEVQQPTDICESSKLRCNQLSEETTQCPYGIEYWVNAVGCEECRCYNPCLSGTDQKSVCLSDYQCVVEVITMDGEDSKYKAVCKPGKKLINNTFILLIQWIMNIYEYNFTYYEIDSIKRNSTIFLNEVRVWVLHVTFLL